jgi:fructose-1,6-bisphosphatase I
MQEILKTIEQASIDIKKLIENGDLSKSEQQNSTGDV